MMKLRDTDWERVSLLPIVDKAVQKGYVSSYTANALNQYEGRTIPGYAGVRGSVNQDASVAVNGAMAWQFGNYFYGGDDADNSNSAVMKELEIIAAYSNLYSAATGSVFVAQTPEEFTYDDDGNLVQDGRWQYTWNGENRLIKAETRNDLPLTVPHITVKYAYDHQGRMVWKQVTENNSPTKTITYLWDDYNIISETIQNQQSTITNHYVWGLDLSGTLQGAGGVGGLVAVIQGRDGSPSRPCLPCYNANGNITEYVDTSGTTVAHYEYSPFGEIVVQSGDLADSFTHRFSTKAWCSITGLSEYELRKYRPNIGRWMSRDPLGDHASPGARVLHDEIATRMAYAAMMNLSMALDEELSDTERKVAVLRSLYWVAGVGKLATGDPSIGLNWSDPFTGSQLSLDPVGVNGGLHLFACCGNDPVNGVDLWGLSSYYNNYISDGQNQYGFDGNNMREFGTSGETLGQAISITTEITAYGISAGVVLAGGGSGIVLGGYSLGAALYASTPTIYLYLGGGSLIANDFFWSHISPALWSVMPYAEACAAGMSPGPGSYDTFAENFAWWVGSEFYNRFLAP